jgi:hypothetical protein
MSRIPAAIQTPRTKALTRTRASVHVALSFLITAAMAGCSGSLEEADAVGAKPDEGQGQGALEIRADIANDTALKGATPALADTPPVPSLTCAPLCNGGNGCSAIQLASGAYGTDFIALADQHVFFGGTFGAEGSEDGQVGSVPKAGGAKTLFFTGLAYVNGVAAGGANGYSTSHPSSSSSHLNELNPNGTTTPLPTVGGYARGVVADSTHLYWVGDDYTIYSLPLSGGSPTVVVPYNPAGGLLPRLYQDDDHLYWHTHGNAYTIMKAPKSGAAAPTLLSALPDFKFMPSLAIDATDVYFTSYDRGLFRMPKTGGTPVQIDRYRQGWTVAVDDERVYWYDREVLKARCKNGSSTEVLTTPEFVEALAVDSTGIYWGGYGKIWKIAK